MTARGWIPCLLALALQAAPPAARTQAWVLALDERGAPAQGLTGKDFSVKVDGTSKPVISVRTPEQTQSDPQSWILVFEPIRDTRLRASAFVAAADFLTKVPGGDRVLIVARGKDSLESLMPGFSLRRTVWAEALGRVPDMLPESFVGMPKETLQGKGFRAESTDTPDDDTGQMILNALLATFQKGEEGWAKGTKEQKGVDVLGRLNFDNPTYVTGLLATVARETHALESLINQVAAVPGQKHLVVFSRCEADDLSHPMIKRAMSQTFQRTKGDLGGPAESASLATRDMTLLQAELRATAVKAGVTLYSVAGTGQNILGHVGTVAGATGGFGFPLVPSIEAQFGQGIQIFGSRYLVSWGNDQPGPEAKPLDLAASRKGLKVIVQAFR